jgi:hypothetical protein
MMGEACPAPPVKKENSVTWIGQASASASQLGVGASRRSRDGVRMRPTTISSGAGEQITRHPFCQLHAAAALLAPLHPAACRGLEVDALSLPRIRSDNIGDEAHRGSASRRADRAVGSVDVLAHPCAATGAFETRCSRRHRISGPGANGLHPRSRCDPGTLDGSSRSVSPRGHSATVSAAQSGDPGQGIRTHGTLACRPKHPGPSLSATRNRRPYQAQSLFFL